MAYQAPYSVSPSVKEAARFPGENRHYDELLTNGFSIISDAIPGCLTTALVEAIERIEADRKPRKSRYLDPDLDLGIGGKTFRAVNLLARDPIFRRVIEFDPLLSLAERLLGAQFLFHYAQVAYVGPGETAQPLHTDDMHTRLPRPHVPLMLNSIWALSDFTEENGATRFVPGSHLWTETPRRTLVEAAKNPRKMETAYAQMQRGSILVFDAALWHGAGANITADQRRLGLTVEYCAGWIRQKENSQLSLPLDLVRSFTPRLQELCGFGLYEGFVGVIDDLSPIEALLDEKAPSNTE